MGQRRWRRACSGFSKEHARINTHPLPFHKAQSQTQNAITTTHDRAKEAKGAAGAAPGHWTVGSWLGSVAATATAALASVSVSERAAVVAPLHTFPCLHAAPPQPRAAQTPTLNLKRNPASPLPAT